MAQLEPLIIDDQLFFDIHGNVNEFTFDSFRNQGEIDAGRNSLGDDGIKNRFVYTRGGSYAIPRTFAVIDNPAYMKNKAFPQIGFRLARTIK